MLSTISETLVHILFLARHLNGCSLQCVVTVMLMELGIPTKCVGFALIKEAVLLYFANPTRVFSKDIYLEISQRYYQCSEEQVDQAIRDAIKAAWKRGNKTAWSWYFSYGSADLQKPTNGEFISRLAYTLELWKGCCREEVCCERE